MRTQEIRYSVLMSVYIKEKLSNLEESVDSILNQTIQTDDFIIVCDGPLSEKMTQYLDDLAKKHENIIRLIKLNNNQGLSNALRIGVEQCKNDLIARMDSDDISQSSRCEKQLKEFEINPELDIVGTSIIEFNKELSDAKYVRSLPTTNDEIHRFAKKRCPFNHVSVMYKKQSVLEAGNYSNQYRLEDYYLWVRMLMNNSTCKNIDEPLVFVRTGDGLYDRRGGFKYLKEVVLLKRYMLKNKFIGLREFLGSMFMYSFSAIMPTRMRTYMYRKFLRNEKKEQESFNLSQEG